MTVVVWAFALLTAAIHVVVFVWEALLIERPAVHLGVFAVPTADVPAVRLWAFGVGFYNLFIACGLVAGVTVWIAGDAAVGRALVAYLCVFTFLSGIVLFVADRLGFSRAPGRAGVMGALGQSTPPLVALTALLLT
jgi:putative membrane protein